MIKAEELLKNPDLSVAEISQAIGFLNVSYFIRIYREATGYTPAIFRQRLK